MQPTEPTPTIHGADFDAWLFDLDGVITDTAGVHADSWKKMFDDYLRAVAGRRQVPFQPFGIDTDYVRFVDGKPRYNGVDSFLRSRGIALAWGTPADPPAAETVCGLGNRKNLIFNDILRSQGCEVFGSSVQLVRRLRRQGKRIAVVTSSKNCDTVLRVTGLADLFDAKVDGNVAAEQGLRGKPDPHTYVFAAQLLKAGVERCVVIEDAISGVQAGSAGGFGLVIGVARHDRPEALTAAGAHIVVGDLGELKLD